MEKFITHITIRNLAVIAGLLFIFTACQQKHTEKVQSFVPDDVFSKSLEYVLLDKKYSRRYLHKDLTIEKNYLTRDLKPFKIGQFNISIFDNSNGKIKDSLHQKKSDFEFYYLTIFGGEVLEVSYVTSFGLHVKLSLKKRNGKWMITESEPWYN